VREDRQAEIHPLSISHGMNATAKDRSRFRLEFDWTGTDDFSAYLCIPEAIRFLAGLLPGGWPALIRHNHELAIAARNALCEAWEVSPPAPNDMLGSMAALPIWDGSPPPPTSSLTVDPQQIALFERFGVEVPIVPWPRPPKRLIRVSAQIYNDLSDYDRLAVAVREMMTPS
jgi:isopenicillin-N epimerase